MLLNDTFIVGVVLRMTCLFAPCSHLKQYLALIANEDRERVCENNSVVKC